MWARHFGEASVWPFKALSKGFEVAFEQTT